MSFRFSMGRNAYGTLRKGFAVAGLIASVTCLLCMFHPNYHWLQRLGLLATILFATGNVVLIYWPKQSRARLEDEDQGGALR